MYVAHNPHLKTYLDEFRRKKKEARERKLAERCDITKRVEALKVSLAQHFAGDPNIRVYVNETQVNVDFLNGKSDKIYLTCSRKHDKVKVDFLLRDVSPLNNQLVFAWFDKNYGLKAKDLSGRSRRNTKMNFMTPVDQVPKLIETIAFDFRPKFA